MLAVIRGNFDSDSHEVCGRIVAGRGEMEVTTKFDSTTNIYTVRVAGAYCRPADGHEVQRMVADFCAAHGCRRVLIDFTGATVLGGTLPTYQTGQLSPDVGKVIRKLKLALLYTVISEEERFFENVVSNRGYLARVFDARDTALAWLEQEQ